MSDERFQRLYDMIVGVREEMQHEITLRANAQTNLLEEKVFRIDGRIDAGNTAVALAFNAAEKAVLKSEDATRDRFESVNEFREQLRDQASGFLPRAEFESQHRELTRQLLQQHDDIATLRQTIAVGPTDLKALSAWQHEQVGTRSATLDIRYVLFSLAGLMVFAGSMIAAFLH